ncbi:MAG: carbamoyltransferase HypF [Bacteroidota bacterium]
MKTYHIHIKGIVQGVGFRPFVYKLAIEKNLKGWVNNATDGVHIHINTSKVISKNFLQNILDNLPPLAVVTNYSIVETKNKVYQNFEIINSVSQTKPNILLTPDAALCKDCKEELYDKDNKRNEYPFITCTNCGPRYSIINKLPYDRMNTSMDTFQMCENCNEEYNNPLERRHFSQTNSCPNCEIEMQLFEKGILTENFTDLDYIVEKWKEGKIIAIKGIGGYLLTCDATNTIAVKLLRKRKQRPTKPFALMYPNIEMITNDVDIIEDEKKELESIHAPIVLLNLKPKNQQKNSFAIKDINNGLQRIGIMLPYTPLYELLLKIFNKPIIATSANITDSTIIYQDGKAVEELTKIADIILMNNREILVPQDDGVIQFSTRYRQKITLRRSRGKAPVYINPDLDVINKTILATGSMLKSVFGLLNLKNIYISQYLGNTASYDAQVNYEKTFNHFEKVFDTNIDAVVTDKHPDYFSTRFGGEIAKKKEIKKLALQHHKAHFYSVLGEHNLLNNNDKILGVVWDGTGLGDDGNIWGGEFFKYKKGKIDRIFHLNEFEYILGDKMAKEPKISAMAIMHQVKGADQYLKHKFNDTEWKIYKKLLQKNRLKSTSMGRLFDAVASILFDFDLHSFEAEASMQLEKEASEFYYSHSISLDDSYLKNRNLSGNFVNFLIENLISDLNQNIDKQFIAVKFHITLVDYIIRIAQKFKFNRIAFSGGVFQNALLIDMVIELMKDNFNLYFHNEFSPNDEGIPFGQLMYYTNKFNDKN